MDRRFKTDEQWFSSEVINLKEFRNEAIDAMQRLNERINVGERHQIETDDLISLLSEKTGCSESAAEQVYEEFLPIENFAQQPIATIGKNALSDDLKVEDEIVDDESQLLSLRNIEKRNSYNNSSRQRKSAYITSLKYDKYVIRTAANTHLYRPQVPPAERCEDDIVLIVDVLQPYNRMLNSTELRSSRLLRPTTKFMIRGDMNLIDLRKKMMCLCDVVVPLEDGYELQNPDYQNTSAELFPSSFIFIHDMFYVDQEHQRGSDISKPIREFMAKKPIFDKVHVQTMQETKVVDLNLRLGQPYVFQHSGNCEHLLVFHDLRLMHPTDPQALDLYPFTVFDKGNDKKCEACHRANVSYVVEKCNLLPNTYTFFCEECFTDFNFASGVKTNTFRAWPYYDLSRLKT